VDGTASGSRPWVGSGLSVTEAAKSATRNLTKQNSDSEENYVCSSM
jgi:hypothetical protein